MEPSILGLTIDSSIVIAAERKGQTVEQLLEQVKRAFGEVNVAVCAVTVAELVHGVYRAQTPEVRDRRKAFIEEFLSHVPVHSVTRETCEIVGRISGEQAAKGITIAFDDLAIGASALERGGCGRDIEHAPFRKDPRLGC
jgi:predicted nucleic acid-binding protein